MDDVLGIDAPETPIATTVGAEPAWFFLPIAELATAIDDTEAWINAREAAVEPARQRAEAMRRRLLDVMIAENATEVTHPYLIVKRTKSESKPVALVSVLREGFAQLVADGVLTEADVKSGLWLETPEPEWRTNLTKLNALRRFGERVRALLERGVHRVDPGWKLTLKPNPKVVDPARTPLSTASSKTPSHDSPAPTTTTNQALSSKS